MGARLGTARTNLSDLSHMVVTCEDCGRENWWTRDDLDEAERCGRRTLGTLGQKLRCIYCVERGGGGRNLSVRAILREETEHVGQ